ncbi:UbiH/UbiF family hydroxylase [Undibacterium terreum]|uniref:Ubiquinone biosynthesis hydroxylase n=1 Tax=Undibacterium terreum TaxID=1224302 RepID=A0A916XNM6_9BURK|nr:UbiH/UbiF family hydroxylase [Undibacterium terreum]GGC89827.1 ubiquinone biosynthesis hydroxylase [Undibacterium terreum]
MSKHTSHSDVCIVGNGAVGKAAALGFSQAGLSVSLLSPAPMQAAARSDDWDVRVYALNHVAQRLLSGLKVWGALDAERVAPVESMQVYGDASGMAGKLNFDAYGAHTDSLAWIVEDRNLNQALDNALRFAQNVSIVTGRATELKADAAQATVRLENGDSLSAALIVGADGAQSWVRGQCEIGLDYRPYGQQGVVSNFACEKPHQGTAYQWFDEEHGIIALLPLPGQRVSLVWSAPDMLAQELLQQSATALAERLAAYCAQQLGALTPLQPELIRAFPLNLMRPHAMTAPRVALIGDAAHVVHPLAGHGMNLGFADVRSLLDTVAQREEYRDCGDARVLSRYARARKEEVLLMQVTTDGLARMFGTNLEPVRLARQLGLNLLDHLPVLKRKLISHAMGK